MSRLNRRRAERLLDTRAGAGPDPLAGLLDAAAGPAAPDELRGLDEARAAFRAREAPTVDRAPGHSVRTGVRRVLRPLVVVPAAVAVVLGGLAAAGAAGRLPAPLQRPAHQWFHAPSPAPRGTPVPPSGPGTPGRTSGPRRSTSSTSGSPTVTMTPSTSPRTTTSGSTSPSGSGSSDGRSPTSTRTSAPTGSPHRSPGPTGRPTSPSAPASTG